MKSGSQEDGFCTFELNAHRGPGGTFESFSQPIPLGRKLGRRQVAPPSPGPLLAQSRESRVEGSVPGSIGPTL